MSTKQEEKQSQKDTQIRRRNRIVNRIGYFLLIIAALAYIAPYLSGHIVYRKSRYCTAAESDARSIAALVGDYFSIPTHTQIKTSDIDYIPSQIFAEFIKVYEFKEWDSSLPFNRNDYSPTIYKISGIKFRSSLRKGGVNIVLFRGPNISTEDADDKSAWLLYKGYKTYAISEINTLYKEVIQ